MGIKKVLKKMMKKELKKHDKKMAKGNKLLKAFMKEFMEYKTKSIGYLEPIFMANVDYPVDDFSAIAYVDASFSDYDRFGSIGIVMLTRTEVIQYSEIPKDLHPSALTSTNHELIAAAKAIEMAKEKHIKRLIIKYDNHAIGMLPKESSVCKSYTESWYKNIVIEAREKMCISFKKLKGHSLEYFNELADILANKALKAEINKRSKAPMTFTMGDKLKEALRKVQ